MSKSDKKKMQVLAGGLAALDAGDLQARFEVREYRKVDLTDLGGNVGKLAETMVQLDLEVASAVQDLYETQASIRAFSGSDDELEIAQALAATKVAAANAYIDEQLACTVKVGNELIPRRRALVAYINAVLSQDFHGDGAAAIQALRDLEDRKVLVMDKEGKGTIVIGIQHYVIPDDWGLKTSHIAKIVEVVRKFAETYSAAKVVRGTEVLRAMEDEAEIELAEALRGATGKCLMWVRGEPRMCADGKTVMTDRTTGHDLYHPGGGLLVEFEAKYVRPIRANKGIERVVAEMVKAGVKIPRKSLEEVKLHLDKFISDKQKFQLCWRFWTMVRNAVAGHKADQMQAAAKQVMIGKAEVTPEQLLGINGSTGQRALGKVGFLEFRGSFSFKREGKRVYNPHFLAKLVESEGKEALVLVEVPQQLNDVLGEHVGKELSIEDNFGHLPFGALMRAIKGQYTQDHTVQRGLEANQAPDEEPEGDDKAGAPATEEEVAVQ